MSTTYRVTVNEGVESSHSCQKVHKATTKTFLSLSEAKAYQKEAIGKANVTHVSIDKLVEKTKRVVVKSAGLDPLYVSLVIHVDTWYIKIKDSHVASKIWAGNYPRSHWDKLMGEEGYAIQLTDRDYVEREGNVLRTYASANNEGEPYVVSNKCKFPFDELKGPLTEILKAADAAGCKFAD